MNVQRPNGNGKPNGAWRSALKPDPTCLDLFGAMSLLSGQQGEELRLAAEQHVLDCPWCATEVDLLLWFQQTHPFESELPDLDFVESQIRYT